MAKNNEYVGVDDKYIPDDEQERTHVQEPIIGSDNAQIIRDDITSGINKLTSKEGQEKVKGVAKKGWKITKGIGIGYMVAWGIGIVLFLVIFIFALVNMIRVFNAQDKIISGSNSASTSNVEKHIDSDELSLHNGVSWRPIAKIV